MEVWIVLVLLGVISVILFALLIIPTMYVTLTSTQIMVRFDRKNNNEPSFFSSGRTLIVPFYHHYSILDLKPMKITIDLRLALSKQNIRVNVPSTYTVGVSTDHSTLLNASQRILGLQQSQIEEMASEILFGQLRMTISTFTIEQIAANRRAFVDEIIKNTDSELCKIGLHVIHLNIVNITDMGGYIKSLGAKAQAEALARAKLPHDLLNEFLDEMNGISNAPRQSRSKQPQPVSSKSVSPQVHSAALVSPSITMIPEEDVGVIEVSLKDAKTSNGRYISDLNLLVSVVGLPETVQQQFMPKPYHNLSPSERKDMAVEYIIKTSAEVLADCSHKFVVDDVSNLLGKLFYHLNPHLNRLGLHSHHITINSASISSTPDAVSSEVFQAFQEKIQQFGESIEPEGISDMYGNEVGGKWSRWSLISVIENQGLYWVAVTSTKGGYERYRGIVTSPNDDDSLEMHVWENGTWSLLSHSNGHTPLFNG